MNDEMSDPALPKKKKEKPAGLRSLLQAPTSFQSRAPIPRPTAHAVYPPLPRFIGAIDAYGRYAQRNGTSP